MANPTMAANSPAIQAQRVGCWLTWASKAWEGGADAADDVMAFAPPSALDAEDCADGVAGAAGSLDVC